MNLNYGGKCNKCGGTLDTGFNCSYGCDQSSGMTSQDIQIDTLKKALELIKEEAGSHTVDLNYGNYKYTGFGKIYLLAEKALSQY